MRFAKPGNQRTSRALRKIQTVLGAAGVPSMLHQNGAMRSNILRGRLLSVQLEMVFEPAHQVIENIGGGGGIRTHGTRKGTTVFETVPIDHSGTPPYPACRPPDSLQGRADISSSTPPPQAGGEVLTQPRRMPSSVDNEAIGGIVALLPAGPRRSHARPP